MAYILDSHTLLWFVSGDKKLPKSVKEIIKDIKQPCFISAASLWEITIKQQIGKLILEISLKELFEFIDRNQIEIIPINFDHLQKLAKLPIHHSDPFDRMIISKAITEDLIVITRDKEFEKYKVNLIWR